MRYKQVLVTSAILIIISIISIIISNIKNKTTNNTPDSVAKTYIQNNSAEGIKFDLVLVKEVGNWIKYRVVPKDTSMDEAQLFMEKVDGEWVVQGFGTSFEGLEKSHPELFK